MSSQDPAVKDFFQPLGPSSRSLSAYPVRFILPEGSRMEFLDVPLGYLLADFLEGPSLVYRECDLFRALSLEQFLPEVRARVLAGYRALGRAKSGERPILDARNELSVSVRQLRRLNHELVSLARGYAFPHARFDGRPFAYVFDSEAEALKDCCTEAGVWAVQVIYSLVEEVKLPPSEPACEADGAFSP